MNIVEYGSDGIYDTSPCVSVFDVPNEVALAAHTTYLERVGLLYILVGIWNISVLVRS